MKEVFRFTPEQSRLLNEKAYDRLIKNLMKYGNKPGDKQKEALKKLIETLTAMAGGELAGRIAFPLQTGLGKTQGIIAFVSTLVEQGYHEVGIIICASKVEALCDIKRALIGEGVPSENVGLIHSYRYDERKAERYRTGGCELSQGFASLPATKENEGRQIVLASHQRIKGDAAVERYHSYNGSPRELLIWDESLIVSESFSVSYIRLAQGLHFLDTPEVRKSPEQVEAIEYLKGCKAIIAAEIERQKKDPGTKPEALTFSYLSNTQIERYKNAVGEKEVVEPLRVLLDISQNPLRVLVEVEQGEGIITYDIVVPRELKNVVVLDASHLIRDLARMDASINIADIEPDMVSYESVILHQLLFPSGRTSMTKEFKKRRGSREICKEIIDVIKDIPQNEAIIVFTHKKRGRFELDFAEILKTELQDTGIDTEAEVEVNVIRTSEKSENTMKPRFVWLTWGQETSLSEYSYCSNVILAGVLHRSYIDIGSAITGQRDDLCMELHNKHIREVIHSEIAHCVYQAMSRGSSRVIEGSVTRPMKVWMIHKTDIKSLIEKVMPGIRWERWSPKYLPISELKLERLKEDIKAFLSAVPGDIIKLSVHRLKKMLKMSQVPYNSFTLALHRAISSLPGWTIQGRSLVRASCPFLCEV